MKTAASRPVAPTAARPRPLLLACAAAAALAGACRQPADQNPGAPTLDFATLTTGRADVLLSGRAEPGTRLVITRDPPLPWDAVPPTRADRSGGRWAVTLPLEPIIGTAAERVHVFTVVAKGVNGLDSDPVQATVKRVRPAVAALRVDLAQPRVALGSRRCDPAVVGATGAVLLARAVVALDEESLPHAGQFVTFRVRDYAGSVEDVVARTDSGGVAVARVEGLCKPGPGRLEARVAGSDAQAEPARFEVLPGPAVSATVVLVATVNGVEQSAPALIVPAGTEVTAKVEARDVSDTPVPAAWSLEASPADAWVAGPTVRFTRAGTYTLAVRLRLEDGSWLDPAPTGTVTVQPDAGGGADTRLRLVASVPAEAVSGVAFPFDAMLVDPQGNEVAPASVTATLSDAAGTVSGRTATLVAAGEATITVKAAAATGPQLSSAPIPVRVLPGPPATLTLKVGGLAAPPAQPLAAGPGQQFSLEAIVRDAAANVVPGAPVTLVPDTGVDLFGRLLTVPTAPGRYAVNGAVDGTDARAIAVVQVVAGVPASVGLSCPASTVAGVPARCSARVSDASGNVLPVTPALSVEASSAGATVSGMFVTLRQAGEATVVATSGALSASARVQVAAAAPATLQLSLNPSSVAAGASTVAAVSLVDAFLNPVTAPFELSTDAPGATVSGLSVVGPAAPGAWRVFARTVPGNGVPGLTASAALTVTPATAPPARVTLTLASPRTLAGLPLRVTTSVADARGNPLNLAPALTVDGRAPDGVAVLFDGAWLVVRTPGLHRVAATAGGVTDERLLVVLPARDLTPPSVSVSLDRDARPAYPGHYEPESLVTAIVVARDAGGLAGVHLRVSGGLPGLAVDESRPYAAPTGEVEERFQFALPRDHVGEFTVVAQVADTSGNGATDFSTGACDAHFSKVGLGASTTARARSVSINDAALGRPAAVAVDAATDTAPRDARVYVAARGTPADPDAPGARILGLGAGGGPTVLWTTTLENTPGGLALLRSTTQTAVPWFLFSGMLRPLSTDLAVMRFGPGIPTGESYAVPALGRTTAATKPWALAVHQGAKMLYVAQSGPLQGSTAAGRLWSLPARDALAAFAVDPTKTGTGQEVYALDLAEHDVHGVCASDGPTADKLYFTSWRMPASGTPLAGLYALPLGPGGRINPSAGASVIMEEYAPTGATRRIYGPCSHVAGATPKVVFTRWDVSASDGGATNGAVVSVDDCSAAGVTCSQAPKILANGLGTPLRSLPGLARVGTTVWVVESDAKRLFRVEKLTY